MFPIKEIAGFILAYYHPQQQKPDWDIPDAVFANMGMTKFVRSDFTFKTNVETLNEDNFDVGHLYQWHACKNIITKPVTTSGQTISVAHTFERHSILWDKPLPKWLRFLSQKINSHYSSTLYGHGLTHSFIDVFNFNVRMEDLIFCTPITHDQLMYTTFVRLVPTEKDLVEKRKSSLYASLIKKVIFMFSIFRLRQEHRHEGKGFWENQSHVAHPILTPKERELIAPYRHWCQQFRHSTTTSGSMECDAN